MIIFNKKPGINNILFAFNNQVIVFHSDSSLENKYADIDVNGEVFRITPHPNGTFRFNLGNNEHILTTLINKNNFSDDLDLMVQTNDVNSLIKDDAINKGYLQILINITITFIDDTTEMANINYFAIKGIKQYDDLKTYNKNIDVQLFTNTTKIIYWQGLPLDVSFYGNQNNNPYLIENKVGQSINTNGYNGINRLIIYNGLQGLENFLTLSKNDEINIVGNYDNFLKIEKRSCNKGVYIKYINHFGQWNYWLFEENHKIVDISKNLKEVFNDFYDIGDNTSPYINKGKSVKREIEVFSHSVDEDDFKIIEDLFYSPKVYMFTGTANTVTTHNNWIEVRFKGSKQTIKNFQKTTYSVKGVIEAKKLTMKL